MLNIFTLSKEVKCLRMMISTSKENVIQTANKIRPILTNNLKLTARPILKYLVDNYGVVSCGAAVFDTMDKSEVVAYRKEDFQYKILVKDRSKAARNYPKALVGPATIEEIMLFHVKGELK